MKTTDYAPRAAPFDSYLKGRDLVGAEIGVDVGAHAEALLTYCPVAMLHLVDPWPKEWARGYCEGRLARFRARVEMHQTSSLDGARSFPPGSLDFAYIDQVHDGPSVTADLHAWWPLVKPGGVLGYRNYAEGRGEPLDLAIDAFVAEHRIRTKYERYLNDLILFR
jgi:predicted O-methyltransferase YrrM